MKISRKIERKNTTELVCVSGLSLATRILHKQPALFHMLFNKYYDLEQISFFFVCEHTDMFCSA